MVEVAIVVPTLGRAHNLKPLLENVRATTVSPNRVYFVVENDDESTKEAVRELDATGVFGVFGSCAKAMNAGYWASTEPFVFTANDDLLFHEGWDVAALDVMSDTTHIVGTNDAHGRMTCFALARRAYIEEHSGVFDKPDTLWHEYTSQYPDTELAEYAKHRGVWGEAPDSITEHLHWEFGKADRNHPNYLKAAETCAADHRTYTERRRSWASVVIA